MDLGFGELRALARLTEPSVPIVVSAYLRRKDDRVPWALCALNPLCDGDIGCTLRLWCHWDGVALGRVYEVHAKVKGEAHLLRSVVVRVLITPGHTAQAALGDDQVRVAKLSHENRLGGRAQKWWLTSAPARGRERHRAACESLDGPESRRESQHGEVRLALLLRLDKHTQESKFRGCVRSPRQRSRWPTDRQVLIPSVGLCFVCLL